MKIKQCRNCGASASIRDDYTYHCPKCNEIWEEASGFVSERIVLQPGLEVLTENN